MSISNWASSRKREDSEVEQRGNRQKRLNDTFTCVLLWMEVVVVIVGCPFRLVCVVRGLRLERPGDSWDVGQFRRRTCQRRRPALQEELPVVDDSGTWGRQQQRNPKLPVVNGKISHHQYLEQLCSYCTFCGDTKCFDFTSLPQQVTLMKAFNLNNEIKLSKLNDNKWNLPTLKCSLCKLKQKTKNSS